ncbi:MAG: NADH-quinone oxidoreductase subunit M [Planctomycetes bacterium]|nr:NADH-quinone oxidoreductase subunit M [Planctomycetota bacterium]
MNEFITNHLLSLIIFVPLIGATVILFIPNNQRLLIKIASLVSAAIPLLLCYPLLNEYNSASAQFQFVERANWIEYFNIEYYIGIDGLSISMVLLTAMLSFICIIASWNIEHWKVNKGIKGYFCLFLLLQTGMTGVFCALDFFLFYVFWELVLLPMYFLIGIWGGPRREYAAMKFFLYTLVGSVLMLVVMLALYFTSNKDGAFTFDLLWYKENASKILTSWGSKWVMVGFVGLFIGFAIKVPIFPFHTWLPDAHVEAPTPVSVILAGVLLKMGVYGLLRISYCVFPDAAIQFSPIMMILGAVNIIYGAMCSMAQIRGVPRLDKSTGQMTIEQDWKKLIAYSSVSHMGYCLIGMAAVTTAGITGAVFEMWNHGIITGALFLLVGVLYDRAHHRNINEFGGLWAPMPYYGGITAVMFMASLGLPGLAGFISEALCLIGGFQASDPTNYYLGISGAYFYKILTGICAIGVVLGAGYFLWSYQRIFLGSLNTKYAGISDISTRELITIVPLLIITILLGIQPTLMTDLFINSVKEFVSFIGMPWITTG